MSKSDDSTEQRSLREAKRRNKIAAIICDEMRSLVDNEVRSARLMFEGGEDIDPENLAMPVSWMRLYTEHLLAALSGETDMRELTENLPGVAHTNAVQRIALVLARPV